MLKYLVLENDDGFIDGTYKPCQRDFSSKFELVFVKTVTEAKILLSTTRFNGAILDLRLSNAEDAEGNEVALQIYSHYFLPIAIVTGFTDELAPTIRNLADSGSSLVKVFNKNGVMRSVFDFLFKIEDSGILQIMGPGGEMNQLLSDIFWKHIGPFLSQWEGVQMEATDRKRVLRHAVAHLLNSLQSHAPGTWDKYLPGEVYIWPPVCLNEMTGDVYKGLQNGVEVDKFYLLVTPACDLASKGTTVPVRHFVEILPFSSFPNEGKMASLISKKEHRYHVLPPCAVFRGGVADFATISVFSGTELSRNFSRKGTVIESYWREIVTRLGAWLGRQGTPEIDKDTLMNLVRAQWPAPAQKTS